MVAEPVDFAALTREVRLALGLTQEGLARKLDVSFGTVNGWENGKHKPIASLARRLVRLASSSGVDLPLLED